jgi:hypothetical protein
VASVTKSVVSGSRNSINLSFAGSENHRVKTNKALYLSEFWLPETIEEEFEVKVMGMKLKIFREIKFDSYSINPPKPETDVLTDAKITFNRDPEKEAEVFSEGERPNRLSRKEEEKLIKFIENEFIASGLISEGLVSPVFSEALKNTAPGRFTKDSWGTIRGLSNLFKYNRIEGLRTGTGFIIYPRRRNDLMFSVNGAYGLSDKKWKGNSGLAYFAGKNKWFYIETGLFRDTAFEEDRTRITDLRNTLSSLVSNADYRDFYYEEGGYIGLGARFFNTVSANLTYYSRSEKNAENNTKFSIFHPSEIFRFNPEIKKGYFRGLSAGLSYKTYNADASAKIDYTDRDALSSDYSFFRGMADLRLFYKPTYFSSLNYRLSAGASDGKLPPQYWFDFGGKVFLDYTGRLRGTGYKAFTGDRFAVSVLEYSLNGSWLRDKGLRLPFMRILKFTLWGGAGWSDLYDKNLSYAANIFTPVRTTDGTYHEFGFGISDAINMFRIDFIRNSISKNSVQIGFNFLR